MIKISYRIHFLFKIVFYLNFQIEIFMNLNLSNKKNKIEFSDLANFTISIVLLILYSIDLIDIYKKFISINFLEVSKKLNRNVYEIINYGIDPKKIFIFLKVNPDKIIDTENFNNKKIIQRKKKIFESKDNKNDNDISKNKLLFTPIITEENNGFKAISCEYQNDYSYDEKNIDEKFESFEYSFDEYEQLGRNDNLDFYEFPNKENKEGIFFLTKRS